MLFKLYYCDDSATADDVYRDFLYEGYDTLAYDRKDCASFDVFPNMTDFTRTKLSIKNSNGDTVYNDTFRYWRNYLVIFEDNTIITLTRKFSPGENSKRNRDKMDAFINAIREKINQPNAIIIQDDDEDFVV